MPGDWTIIAGIKVPSTSPFFLAIVGVHFLLGIACVISGAGAMLSPKRRGRHPMFGRILFLVPQRAFCFRDRPIPGALG